MIDEIVVRQTATATGSGSGSVAIGGRAFEASFDIVGSTVFTIEQPYDDPRCVQFNGESPYTGSGTISDTVAADGAVTVATSWGAGSARVTRPGSVVGTVG